MGNAPTYKIGEVAKKLNTTPRTLRFYEEEGLVLAHRTAGGTRLYVDEDIERFKAILHLAEAGIPISLVRELATLRSHCDTGRESSSKLLPVIDSLNNKIADQIESLEKLRADLELTSNVIQKCHGCGNQPSRIGCPSCPVNQHINSSEVLNLIWDQA